MLGHLRLVLRVGLAVLVASATLYSAAEMVLLVRARLAVAVALVVLLALDQMVQVLRAVQVTGLVAMLHRMEPLLAAGRVALRLPQICSRK